MTTLTFTRGRRDLFEAPDIGWFKPKGMLTTDSDAGAAGIGELTFSRNWTSTTYTATDPTGRVRGVHRRTGWGQDKGPIEWDDVQYDLATHSHWKGSFVLRRHNEDLATFAHQGFTASRIVVEVLDGAHVPPGLVVFCAWMTLLRVRDTAATSSVTT